MSVFLFNLTDDVCGVKMRGKIFCLNSTEMLEVTLGELFACYSSVEKLELVVAWLLQFWLFLYSNCFNVENCPTGGHITLEKRRHHTGCTNPIILKVLSVIAEHPKYNEK